MGRKIKMNQLDEKEYEWVLGVIHRDFDLRRREQERLNKIESELNEAANQRNILAKRKEFNEKCCILCCSAFNLLFNKKLQCGNCQFLVCRNCATWESQAKTWLCHVCDQQRILYVQSCEWFYEHIQKKFQRFGSAKVLDQLKGKRKESGIDSENDSGYGPAFSDGNYKGSPLNLHLIFPKLKLEENGDAVSVSVPVEEQTSEAKDISKVRQHIETVVEGLVGDSLDTARVDKAYSHSQYLQLFTDFHKQLVVSMLKLRQALETAILNKPNDGSAVTPTTAHVNLKQIIVRIGENVAALPCLERCESQKLINEDTQNSQGLSKFSDSYIFQSYEELLASAVINKLVDQSQKLQYGTSGRESSQSELSTSDNDVPLKNKASGIMNHSVSSCSTDSERESVLDDLESGGVSAADEFLWASNLDATKPRVEYVIEERIEEITQEEYTDGDEEHRSPQNISESSRKSSRKPLTRSYSSVDEPPVEKNVIGSQQNIPELDFLNAWDLVESHRVPFPEFGVDIIDNTVGFSDEDCENYESEANGVDVGSRPSCISAWEENWLFRKKKLFPYGSLRHQLLGFYGESPCLLIPNSQENNSHAQIDSRDIDQLSDLSEQNSVGSLDFSDSERESDSELKSTDSAELVRLAQNVAQHFAKVEEPHTSTPKIKPTKSNYYNEPSKKQTSPTKVKQLKSCRNPPTPPPITLPIPCFVDVERRLSCIDPVFVFPPEDSTIHAGKVAQFTCHVKGTRPISVSWFRECQLIKEDQRHDIQQVPEKGIYSLHIYDTDAGDSGIYSCVAYGQSGGQNWADFSLKIKATSRAHCAPEFIVPLRVVSSVPGKTARLSCTLSGYPEPRAMLFHNRRLISASLKHSIENLGYGEWVVEISNLEKSDEGGYEVVASNRMGHAVSTITHKIGEITNQGLPNDKVERSETNTPKENKEKLVYTSQPAVKSNLKNESNKVPFEPPIVIQRTWLDRQQEIKTKGNIVHRSNNINGNAYAHNEAMLPSDLSLPPKPGSIAEREHRKWQTAAPLQNNPYSRENVTKKKLERRISDLSLSDSPMTFEEFSKQREHDEQLMGNSKLGSSLEKEYDRYKRDYYVHDSTSSGSHYSPGRRNSNSRSVNKSNLAKASKPKNVINNLEEKVYESASQLISLDNEVQQLEEEVRLRVNDLSGVKALEDRVAQALAEEQNARRKVLQVESEVKNVCGELLRKSSICSSSSDSYANQNIYKNRQSYVGSSDEDVSANLPSVKKLANLFVNPKLEEANGHSPNPTHHHSKQYIDDEKDVIIVESDVSSSSNNQNSPFESLQANPGVSALSRQFLSPPPAKYQVEANVHKKKIQKNDEATNRNISCHPISPIPPVVKLLSRQFSSDDQSGASVQRVHSLTARSLSKEFRQLTKNNVPRPMNRTLSISSSSQPTSLDTDRSISPMTKNNLSYSPSGVNAENERDTIISSSAGGYTSDESSATSNPSSSLPRQKTKRSSMSKTILQRASYWERRAEHGLLSDNSVNEDFPSIDSKTKESS